MIIFKFLFSPLFIWNSCRFESSPTTRELASPFFSIGFELQQQRRWRFSFNPFFLSSFYFTHIQVARCRFGLRSHRRPTFRSLERCQSHSLAAFGTLWCHCHTSKGSLVSFVAFFPSAISTVLHSLIHVPLTFSLFLAMCVKLSNIPPWMWEFINALLLVALWTIWAKGDFISFCFLTFPVFFIVIYYNILFCCCCCCCRISFLAWLPSCTFWDRLASSRKPSQKSVINSSARTSNSKYALW